MDKLQKQPRLNPKWLDKKIQEIQQTKQYNRSIPISKSPVDVISDRNEDKPPEEDDISASWHSWLEKSTADLGPMPDGWKIAENIEGKIYFVNNHAADPCPYAQWDDPRTQMMLEDALQEYMRDVGQDENEADSKSCSTKMKIPEIKISMHDDFNHHSGKDDVDHDDDKVKFNLDLDESANDDDDQVSDLDGIESMSSYEVVEFENQFDNVNPELKNDDHESEDDESWQPWLEKREVTELRPLPEGWKLIKTNDGSICYQNYGVPCPYAQWEDPRTQIQTQKVKSEQPLQIDCGPLPSGWEEGQTTEGEIYYLNHIEQYTQWADPRIQRITQAPVKDDFGPLPDGWFEGQHLGRIFYLNHVDKYYQWEDPRRILKVKAEEKHLDEKSEDDDQNHVQRDQLPNLAQLSENLIKLNDNSSSVSHSDQSLIDTDDDQDHNQEQVDEEETENEFVIGDFVHQDIFGTEEITNAVIAVLFLVFAALYQMYVFIQR